jgi:hypothetical protein
MIAFCVLVVCCLKVPYCAHYTRLGGSCQGPGARKPCLSLQPLPPAAHRPGWQDKPPLAGVVGLTVPGGILLHRDLQASNRQVLVARGGTVRLVVGRQRGHNTRSLVATTPARLRVRGRTTKVLRTAADRLLVRRRSCTNIDPPPCVPIHAMARRSHLGAASMQERHSTSRLPRYHMLSTGGSALMRTDRRMALLCTEALARRSPGSWRL